MKVIFFNAKKLVVCSYDTLSSLDVEPTAMILYNPDEESIAAAISRLDAQDNIPIIYIVGDSADKIYADVCAYFHEVDAAGGVVENDREEVLLIRRNGIWDLPKGHREAGEDIEVTALREVEEECGIACELGSLVCITDHTYHRDGKFVLKHTYWYRMIYSGTSSTIPQTEEGITETRWAGKTTLGKYISGAYPSIATVLISYL